MSFRNSSARTSILHLHRDAKFVDHAPAVETGHGEVLPFSCKGRGVCSSCSNRRMFDLAAHLVDRVLPRVQYRQWVLSLPFRIRYLVACDALLLGRVLRIFLRAISDHLRSKARRLELPVG